MNAFRERPREYDDRPKYNPFKSYNSTPIVIKKDFLLKEDDFPDLATPVTTNSSNVKSFASLLKKDEEISETFETSEKDKNKNEEIDEIIPPGWSYYKYTRFKNGLCGDKNSEVTTKIQKPFININTKFQIVRKKVVLNEAEEVFNALTLLHEKRTNEYKELWGESEWERMFICPNHDYEYFDKLDEAYEEEEAKFEEQYYNDDNEDSDNY
jgi:hypothetical protein